MPAPPQGLYAGCRYGDNRVGPLFSFPAGEVNHERTSEVRNLDGTALHGKAQARS
ncbi:hypothetical protein ES703_41132 [subsurface metagenome]